MTQPSDNQQNSIRCRNCGHENLSTAIMCLVCDTPLSYTSRFQREKTTPTGLLSPAKGEIEQQEAEENRRIEEARQKFKTQQALRAGHDNEQAPTTKHKTSHRCQDCGYNNRIGDYFCVECGANLSSSPTDESPADVTQEMKALQLKVIEAEMTQQNKKSTHQPQSRALKPPKAYESQSATDDFDMNEGSVPDGYLQFHNDMVLRITEIESGQFTDATPSQKKPLLIGRTHNSLPMQPDIDLTPYLTEGHGVSRRHALIRLLDTRLEIQDLNSTNGTSLNGHSFNPKEVHQVRSGDILTLGSISLSITFKLPDARVGTQDTDILG